MTIFMILLMLGFVGAGVMIILNGKGSKRVREARKVKQYKKYYRFFSRFFLTQTYLAQIYGKLANLSIYRKDEIQVLSVKYLMTSIGAGGALIVTSFFLFKDFLTILICILFGLLLATLVVDKKLDGMHYRIMKSMANALSAIRQEYMRTNSVVEALNDAEIDDIIKKPMDEISNILMSSNAELRLQEFCEATPFRTMQTLAGICYQINNQGDEKDIFGQSNFNLAITLMLSDVNSEIQKIAYRKKAFGFIEYLPFAPIFGMGIIESFFISIMPGTALVYNGPLGYLFRTITVVLSIIAYVIVSRINCNIPIKEDDRTEAFTRMLDNPRMYRFIFNIIPKNKKAMAMDKTLKQSLSRMSLEHLYLKKLTFALAAFALALLCAVSTISLGRDFIQNSTQQLSLVATGEMDGMQEKAIRNLDQKYLANPTSFSDQQLTEMVMMAMPGLSDLQAQDQVKRLKDKHKSLENAYFHWWYIWLCVGVGVIGWFSPNIMLKVRKILVETEEEDDFLQLQTLASILINTNVDTLDILGQFAQHSRVHKDMFMYAYQGYPSNPELELTRLQAKTPLVPFKRFIGKLKLTISDLSLRDAYSDLLIERDHILRMRDMTIEASINRKRGICGPLSMVPIGSMVIGSFLVPIGILGFNEFSNAINMM